MRSEKSSLTLCDFQRAHERARSLRSGISTLPSDRVDERAAHDHAVGYRSDRLDVFGLRDAEADGQWKVGDAAEPLDLLHDRRDVDPERARDAHARDDIKEAVRHRSDGSGPLYGRRRGDELGQPQSSRSQLVAKSVALLEWEVRYDRSQRSSRSQAVGKTSMPISLDWVGIPERDQGRPSRCPDIVKDPQHPFKGCTTGEGALPCRLDRRSIGERVAIGNAQLHGIGAGFAQRTDHGHRRLGIRVAGHDVGDERGPALSASPREELLVALHHRRTPSIAATCITSLSPRPERQTTITRRGSLSRARRIAYATACALSSAGTMPSSRASSWNASSASSSPMPT